MKAHACSTVSANHYEIKVIAASCPKVAGNVSGISAVAEVRVSSA